MSDMSSSNPIIDVDEYIANERFNIAVVTPSHFATAVLKTNKREVVLRALRDGADPIQTFNENAPLGQPPRIVPLSEIEALEWYADDAELKVRYYDAAQQQTRTAYCRISSTEARRKLIDAIKQIIGECEHHQEPASIWHIGFRQLLFSVLALLICGGLAVIGFLDPDPEYAANLPGRGGAIGDLVIAVGGTGMVLIGMGIIAAMMTWWYGACRNPPLKSIATRVRQAG